MYGIKNTLVKLAMRFHLIRMALLASYVMLAYILYILYNHSIKSGYNMISLTDDIKYFHPNIGNVSCLHPNLDLYAPEMMKFFTPNQPIECNEESDWVCLGKGMAYICKETLRLHKGVRCKYTFLRRASDFSTVENETVDGGSEPVVLKSDFFKVSCIDSNGITWSNIMAGVRYDSEIHDRTSWGKANPAGAKLNVLIWGIDSLSRNTFIRKLPLTYSFLTDTLDSVILQGYNIVGDGTPMALLPILTGNIEPELPEARRRKWGKSNFVNVYPFLWKDFASQGYVTTYAEDSPEMGTFTYRLNGFGEQPTDHYLRTFYVAAKEEYSFHNPFCLRGTPRHKLMMNWLLEIFNMYSEKPKFVFSFHSELSHNDYNLVGAADEDLRDMLKILKERRHLESTLLIMMSDHGHRFAEVRELLQGKQEERLPYFSITFPQWFRKKYPQAIANLQKNENRVTTPFDIYATLRNILNMTDKNENLLKRSISLFNEIPPSRTCRDADIDAHWCTCLSWELVSIDNEIVLKAVDTAVAFFNALTEQQRDLCSELKSDLIVWAGKYTPGTSLLKFKESKDYDGIEADLSADGPSTVEFYQIKFHTTPGGGHFEVSVKYDTAIKTFSMKKEAISRVNKYGHAADCVRDTHEHLSKLCYCKQQN